MAFEGFWHHPSITVTRRVLGHIATVSIGVIMIVLGFGLSLTMILLPVGIVVELVGVAVLAKGCRSYGSP